MRTLRPLRFAAGTARPGTAGTVADASVNGGTSAFSAVADTASITITALNDAPVHTFPATATFAEDTQGPLTGISVSDVDAYSNAIRMRLAVSNGILNVTLSGGATISNGANGSSLLEIRGTIADINNTLTSLFYKPDANVAGVGADTLFITTNDDGNTGGAAQITADSVQLDVTGVNDDETIVTNTGMTVAENAVVQTITQAMLETTDVENGPALLIYTLDADPLFGTLELSGTVLNVGDTWTQDDINSGRLTYSHSGTEDFTDSFDFSVDDGLDAVSSDTFSITITPVNDQDPIITSDGGGATAALTVNETRRPSPRSRPPMPTCRSRH